MPVAHVLSCPEQVYDLRWPCHCRRLLTKEPETQTQSATGHHGASDTRRLRKTILARFPDLAGATFTLATAGWHSTAVDVDDRLIFKFPRHEIAEKALIKEASLLSAIRPNVSMAVPDLKLHNGPPLFSVHGKLKGEHLVTADYDKLSETERRRLGWDLGQFYAELHRLDDGQMAAAGAGPVEQWQTVETIRRKALPALPTSLRALAAETVEAFERLGPDPHGSTYGFFDGHGWNMRSAGSAASMISPTLESARFTVNSSIRASFRRI